MPQDSLCVADTLGKAPRSGVQQDSGRLEGASCQHDHFATRLAMDVGSAFHIGDTFRLAFPIHQHVGNYRVADQGEMPSAGCGWKSDRRTVEIRSGMATPLALITIVAC